MTVFVEPGDFCFTAFETLFISFRLWLNNPTTLSFLQRAWAAGSAA
jgi:hypothetical protein